MWFKGTWHQTSFHPIFRNKHIMIDLGTGNNNKINWTMEDKQEMIDIIETVYRGARKGRGLVVSPKDYSTKYRYWFFFYFSSPFCWSSLFFSIPAVLDRDYKFQKSRIFFSSIFFLPVKEDDIVVIGCVFVTLCHLGFLCVGISLTRFLNELIIVLFLNFLVWNELNRSHTVYTAHIFKSCNKPGFLLRFFSWVKFLWLVKFIYFMLFFFL